MPGRFKDYIAIPRINGYQSLHTTLFGPNGMPIEVQIRTEDMHRVAESGIAAHWQYKAGEAQGRAYSDHAHEWLKQLMEMQQGGNSEEFMESVKLDLFPDKVYVFTPKGDIRRLPRNSTAVDFAYDVHTVVGNHCVAAKIDRRLVPLRTPLRNGQTVEIITAKGATPNPAWVNFVVTAKARAAIRHYLKGLKHSEAIELGKRLLNQALSELSLSLKKIDDAQLQQVVADLGLEQPDQLFEQIGLGERLAPLVARRLLPTDSAAPEPLTKKDPLAIAGTEGLVVSYARCCFPIPNDPIMAYLSSGSRCRHPSRVLRQPAQLPQTARQVAVGKLAGRRRSPVRRRDPGRGRKPGRRAGGPGLRHRRDPDEHRPCLHARKRYRCVDDHLRTAGARPQASGQGDQECAQDAGRPQGHPHLRLNPGAIGVATRSAARRSLAHRPACP